MVTEESTKDTVKTIVQGMPAVAVYPWLLTRVLFAAHAASGATRIRHSLRPLLISRAVRFQQLGHPVPRECGCMFPVIASEAVAVGTLIAERPPHRSVRAAFPHTAPTSGVGGKPAACAPAPVSRSSGSASGTCFAGSHSPWSQPFAPPTPQRIAPSCSPASQLL